MPFDGRRYGRLPLTPPIGHHSGADAVGAVLAGALVGSYCYSREANRICGYQTYTLDQRLFDSEDLNTLAAATAGTFKVADIRCWLPSHATHVYAEVTARLRPDGDGVITRNLVSVTDGSNTDTGTLTSVTHDVEASPLVYAPGYSPFPTAPGVRQRELSGLSYLDPGDPHLVTTQCFVALSTVTLGDEVRVLVDANAITADGGAASWYWPLLVSAWWECEG